MLFYVDRESIVGFNDLLLFICTFEASSGLWLVFLGVLNETAPLCKETLCIVFCDMGRNDRLKRISLPIPKQDIP